MFSAKPSCCVREGSRIKAWAFLAGDSGSRIAILACTRKNANFERKWRLFVVVLQLCNSTSETEEALGSGSNGRLFTDLRGLQKKWSHAF